MLVHITNRCFMGCPHCLQDANPLGGMMDKRTFKNIVNFAVDNGVHFITIGGGEPTEHPDLVEFCTMLEHTHIQFSIVSNGMWLEDGVKSHLVEIISKFRNFAAGQIYTNPKWYRLHDRTVEIYNNTKSKWYPLKWHLVTDEIRNMLDIGRAKTCKEALVEVGKSKYHNSCLSSCVTAAQTNTLSDFFHLMLMQGKMCTPMISYKGDIHMSESILCPSTGTNINTNSYEEIWNAMKRFRPCGGCTPCKRYLTENSYNMMVARRLLGQ